MKFTAFLLHISLFWWDFLIRFVAFWPLRGVLHFFPKPYVALCFSFWYEIPLRNFMLSGIYEIANDFNEMSFWDFMFDISLWHFLMSFTRFHMISSWDVLMIFRVWDFPTYVWDFPMIVHCFCYKICLWDFMLLSCYEIFLRDFMILKRIEIFWPNPYAMRLHAFCCTFLMWFRCNVSWVVVGESASVLGDRRVCV